MLKLFQSNTYLIWVSMLVLVAVLQGIAISKDKVNPKHVASLSISQNFALKQAKKPDFKIQPKPTAKMYAVSMARAVESKVKVDFVELEALKDIPDSPLTYLEEKKTPKLSESIPQFKEAKKVDVAKLVKKKPIVSPRYIYHKVERGETLVQIAKMYELNVNQLILYNDISDPDQIYPGFKLKVHFDPTFKHVVRDGDTLWSISRMYGVKASDIKEWNKISGNSVRAGLGLDIKIKDVSQSNIQRILKARKRKSRFIWPYRGRLTDKMGWRTHPVTKTKNHHNGIDIAGPIGDGIFAVDGGKVIHAKFSSVSGNLIIIKHSSGYTSRYAHCSKLFVKKGQTVRQGQKIAEIGDTGRVTGAHLHFELRKGKKVLDPLKYL
ncbi:MAG: M23 family metallopeptidase [Candidatus Cloacimonetes bacterium]|nr:M23 family metallopeptidase [Candidatus Cloacimonadota bacterium]